MRRGHVGYAAQRPQHDLVRPAADLAAGQGMTEFMQQHDQEEREILRHVPPDGRVVFGPAADAVEGDQEPGPVKKDGDTRKAKQAERSLMRRQHAAEVARRVGWSQGICTRSSAPSGMTIVRASAAAQPSRNPRARVCDPQQPPEGGAVAAREWIPAVQVAASCDNSRSGAPGKRRLALAGPPGDA